VDYIFSFSSYLPLLRIPSGYQMPSLIVLSILRPLTGPVAFTEWAIFITSLGCTMLELRLPTWQTLMAVGWFFVSRQTMTNLSRSASTRNGFSSLVRILWGFDLSLPVQHARLSNELQADNVDALRWLLGRHLPF
jgi:hypothetical protein